MEPTTQETKLQQRIDLLERSLCLHYLALENIGQELMELSDAVDGLYDDCKTLDQPKPDHKLIQRGIDKVDEFASRWVGTPLTKARTLLKGAPDNG